MENCVADHITVDSDTFSNKLSALLTKEESANFPASTADSHGEEELIQASRPNTARKESTSRPNTDLREGSSLIRLVSDGLKSIKSGINETLWTQIDDVLEEEGKWLKAAAASTDDDKDKEEDEIIKAYKELKLEEEEEEGLAQSSEEEKDELNLDAIDFSSLLPTENQVDEAADSTSENQDKPQHQKQKDFSHIKVAVRVRPPRHPTTTSTSTTLPPVAAAAPSNSMSLRRYNNNSRPSSGYGVVNRSNVTTGTSQPAININKGPALKIDPETHTITAAPVPSAHPTTASLMGRRPLASSSSSSLLCKEEKKFLFDDAFSSQTSQQQVYEASVSPLVDTFLAGHNSTLLAYGQTGTGKTHTMGTDGIPTDINQAGMLPRVALTVFDHVQCHHKEGDDEYSVECQFLEVYNDDIIDLLRIEVEECMVAAVEVEEEEEDGDEEMTVMAPEQEQSATKKQQQLTKDTASTIKKTKRREMIHVREADDGQVVVIGAVKESCATFNDLLMTFHRGAKNRSVGSTLMNERSSRSHAIFTIILHRRWRSATSGAKMRSTAKFHLVDLAGSERQRRTGAAGARLKESSNINTGLLALGKVINALAKASKESNGLDNADNNSSDMAPPTYIPVRDHKLTRLLADSLGRDSATVLIACVSPEMENLEESINTLQFANRTRKVKVKPEARIKAELLTSEASVYGTITTVLKEVGISWTRDGKPKLEGLLHTLTDNSVWEVLLAYRQAKLGLTGHGLSYIPRLPLINTSSSTRTRAGQVVPLCNPAAAGLLGRQTDKNLQSGDIMEALRREAEGLDDDDMLVRIVGGKITTSTAGGALSARERGDGGEDTPLSRLLFEIALRDEQCIQQAIEEQMRIKKAQKGALKKVGSVFKKMFGMSKKKKRAQ